MLEKRTNTNKGAEIMTPQELLRHHVTGAIERGEKEAIAEQPIKFITAQEILTLRDNHHPVFVHSRSKRVSVDGFKIYYITAASLAVLRHWNNGKVN